MYTLGIPKRDYRRATQVLSYETQPPISYHENLQDDGFYMFTFPEAGSEDDFRYIVEKLKGEGIRVIGADSQLTEKQIMKLANLIEINESLQVTTNDGKVAIVSDPEDIKTFYKGGTVFGDDNDGDSIELSKETSLDFQSVTQEGSCGYAPKDEDPNEADQPAGPHLLRKKIREIIESFADDPNVPGITGMEDSVNNPSVKAEKILNQLAKSFGDIPLNKVVNDTTYKRQAITAILFGMMN